MRLQHKILGAALVIIIFFLGCATAYLLVFTIAKALETPDFTTGNITSLTRPYHQTWSEMEIAERMADERYAEDSRRAQEDLAKSTAILRQPESQDSDASGPNVQNESFSGGVEQWRSLVEAYSWCGWNTDRMLRIMQRESGGDPTNHPDGSYQVLGLFQIWNEAGEYDNEPWYDPVWNVSHAAEAFAAHGYSPWAGTDY
jgi:hypothetical protein